MRTIAAAFAMLCFAMLLMTDTNVAGEKKAEKKEVVLKGKVCCAKCELNVATECQTVIVVQDPKSKKDVVVYFDKASHDKYHDDICTAAKSGTVTGIVKDQDKKKIVSVKKVTYE